MNGFVRSAVRALLCGAAAFAVPAAAGDDVAADWRRLLTEGDSKAIYATYDLIAAVQDDSGAIDAARCRDKAEAIAKALVTNPVGLALWSMAQECARAAGDTALAEQRADRFEALVRHTFASYRVGEELPMRVISMRDVDAAVAVTGQKFLYAVYLPYDGERDLSYLVGLWDEKTQRENILEFDFLDTMVQLRRDDPETEFPKFRRAFVSALTGNAHEESPGSELARLHEFQVAEGKQVLEVARRHAFDGDLMGAMAYGIACGEVRELGCRDDAIDALLPFAEKRHAIALATLAFVYARQSNRSADLKAAAALIEQADARLGDAQGSATFLVLAGGSADSVRLAGLVEKPLAKAAKRGDLFAGATYAATRMLRLGKLPGKRERGYIEAAANAGIPRAQLAFARVLISENRRDEAVPLMRSAAEEGVTEAQAWLGQAYYRGKSGLAVDQNEGLKWLKLAAHDGNAAAAAMVGAHYFDESNDAVDLRRAKGWLQSAMLGNDANGAFLLGMLYERNVADIGTPEDAAEVYESIIEAHDDVRARRRLARLLLVGKGVKADVPRAETLLLKGAAAGDVESQAVIGAHLLKSPDTVSRRAEGLDWTRKAAAAGNIDARLSLASVLWHGRVGEADPAAARELWKGLIRDDVTMARNEFAWAVCTPRDAARLDAKAGIEAAESLATRDKAGFVIIDTFAACQAAAGDYAAAVATQQRAISVLESRESPDQKTLEGMRARLAQYRRGERAVE